MTVTKRDILKTLRTLAKQLKDYELEARDLLDNIKDNDCMETRQGLVIGNLEQTVKTSEAAGARVANLYGQLAIDNTPDGLWPMEDIFYCESCGNLQTIHWTAVGDKCGGCGAPIKEGE